MYKYAFLIICTLCFFCSGCEEKAAPPPPKSKIVSKKIDLRPTVLKSGTKPVSAPAASAGDSRIENSETSNASGVRGSGKITRVSIKTEAQTSSENVAASNLSAAKSEDPLEEQLPKDDSTLSEQELEDILNAAKTVQDDQKKPSGYSARNKVDPFEPLFKPKPAEKPAPAEVKEKPAVPARRLTPLEKVDLDQLNLVGIVRAASGNKALVEDASGKGYIVIRGTYMGIHSGKVVDILKDRIVVEEEDNDVLGNKRVHKRELKFQRPSGDEYYEM